MTLWWILLAFWVVAQVPFITRLKEWQARVPAHSFLLACLLILPGRRWESRVSPGDLHVFRAYARFLKVYYYCVFAGPILSILLGAGLSVIIAAP